jgi:hypothetical protein
VVGLLQQRRKRIEEGLAFDVDYRRAIGLWVREIFPEAVVHHVFGVCKMKTIGGLGAVLWFWREEVMNNIKEAVLIQLVK